MSKLNEVALRSAKHYGGETAALDPASIGAFLELIMSIVAMFQDCKKKPTDAAQASRNPNLFERLRLRHLVRNSMSLRDWRQHGDQILEALHKTGRDSTPAEWESLYQEV